MNSANPKFWAEKSVLVTGGAGFIGSHLTEQLVNLEAEVTVADSLESGTLRNLEPILSRLKIKRVNLLDFQECSKACGDSDLVLNLAAKVAGVAYNSTHSADMFRTNVTIGQNMLEAARLRNVSRFLSVSSACVYSNNATVPTPETEGFLGEPEPSNLGYGWAKRLIEVQSRLYAEQYGMDIAIVRPFNTYGPRDHFTQDGHVIPSLIKRTIEGNDPLMVWGDGAQTRSFVYVSDVARGMILAAEKAPLADPINIGNEEEVSIGNLARLVINTAGRRVSLQFDKSKPRGQLKRCPDTQKAKDMIGYEARVGLSEGLKATIAWYQENLVEPPVSAR